VKAVNLIPSDQRAGGGPVTGESDGGAFMVIGLLVGLAVMALLYGVASHQVSSRKGEVASITAQAQATQARANELSPYVSFKTMYQSRLQAVSQLVGTRFDWAHAFHEIGRVLPADASLSVVHGTIGAATGSSSSATPAAPATPAASSTPAAAGTVASATPPGAVPTFILTGCATSQSEVAETLQRLRLIDGVTTVTLQSSTKSGTGSGSGSGGCPPKDPAFSMQVAFSPLPTPSAPSATPTASTASATTPTPGAGGAQ
jgi:type II secretory pathway pseudopilin PulG